ncbi:MAG: hypothetical protein PHH54_06980 [Candidatus Nanoarchaeia archaeon]|nr:hypothetical protein [Candidatus Nanoarchaeia archaeon]MDD5741699.1 hypothetical protein [Candidatus Nanoarchaeia archaeon]
MNLTPEIITAEDDEIMNPENMRRFVDYTHDGLGKVRALFYNPKTKQYEFEKSKCQNQ